jgi:hypothetical protein
VTPERPFKQFPVQIIGKVSEQDKVRHGGVTKVEELIVVAHLWSPAFRRIGPS